MNLLDVLLTCKVPIDRPDLLFREKCWIIRGFKTKKHYFGVLFYQGEGGLSSVEFDWRKATSKNIIGFYHTHPSGIETPSNRDDRTMGALVRAEGRPLLCGILTDHTNNCYIYKRAEDRSIESIRLNNVNVIGHKLFIAEIA
jgi:hypothetical protein